MSTNFSVTRDDIIKNALKEVGAFGTSETPSSEDIADASFAFNLIIKAWVKRGMPLWKIVDITVPLIVGNVTYQIGTTATGTGAVVTDRPLRVFDTILRTISSNQDIPLMVLSRQEYEQFGIKNSLSIPNSIYYQPLIPNGLLTIYPAPADTTRSIHLFAQIPLNDVNVGTDVLDFPSECFQALKWNLCAEIGGPYVSSIPKLQRIDRNAELYKREMEDWSIEEANLYFSRDYREQ